MTFGDIGLSFGEFLLNYSILPFPSSKLYSLWNFHIERKSWYFLNSLTSKFNSSNEIRFCLGQMESINPNGDWHFLTSKLGRSNSSDVFCFFFLIWVQSTNHTVISSPLGLLISKTSNFTLFHHNDMMYIPTETTGKFSMKFLIFLWDHLEWEFSSNRYFTIYKKTK